MSYLLNSLQDRAIGYWSFSGTLNDLTSGSNTATGTASFTSPPLIAIGGSAMRVTSTASVVINSKANYAWLTKNTFSSPFSFSFWFSFNNQMTGSNYGKGIYKNDQLVIFSVKNSDNTVVSKVYYDYLTNTIRFSIPGTSGTNTEAYYVVEKYDTEFYILVKYDNGSAQINVNGVEGNSGTIYDMPDYSYSNYSYVIDGLSLNPDTVNSSSATNFIVNSLEFQTYNLKDYQINKKYLWGFNDGKPLFQSKINASTSFISFVESNDRQGEMSYFQGYDFEPNQNNIMNNLTLTGNGLAPLIVSTASIFNKNTVTASGIDFTNGGSVVWSDFGKHCNLSSNLILTAQINRTIGNKEHVFYIDNVNNGNDLYLEYDPTVLASAKYLLRYKDATTGSVSTLLDYYLGASTTTSNIALVFSASSIILFDTLYSSSSVYTETSSSGTSIPLPLYNKDTSKIYVGNYDNSLTFKSKIKNIGITDYPFLGTSSLSFETASTFLIKLTSSVDPTIVSQHGYWKTNIPTIVAQKIVQYGTQIDWDGMDSARVYVSTDSASTYTLVNRGTAIPTYSTTSTPRGIIVKVDIDSDANVYDYNQTFNRLNVYLYSNLEFISDSYTYRIAPSSQSSSNYVPKNYPELNPLKRPNNFGIKFTGASPNPAVITTPGGVNYYGVDFWYRADTLYSGSGLRTNLIKNPSFETNVSSFLFRNANSSSFSQNAIEYVVGTKSLLLYGKYVSNAGPTVYFTQNAAGSSSDYANFIPVSPNTTYFFSAYVKDINYGSARLGITFYNSSSTSVSGGTSSAYAINTASWTRLYVAVTSPSAVTNAMFFISTLGILPTSSTTFTPLFYIDAVMAEQSSVIGDYFDGSYNTASWTGTANLSTSQIYNFNYILSNSSSALAAPSIYIDGAGAFRSLGGTLYVNGASVVDGAYKVKQKEPYHLFLVMSSSYSNNLYLNGGVATPSTSNPSTYGDIQFWNSSSVSASTPSARYQSFIVIPQGSVTDINTTSYTDSIVARKIGI